MDTETIGGKEEVWERKQVLARVWTFYRILRTMSPDRRFFIYGLYPPPVCMFTRRGKDPWGLVDESDFLEHCTAEAVHLMKVAAGRFAAEYEYDIVPELGGVGFFLGPKGTGLGRPIQITHR